MEISADGLPVFRRRMFLRMSTYSIRREDGSPQYFRGMPFELDFRDWVDADEVDGELDLDAMRDDLKPSSDAEDS